MELLAGFGIIAAVSTWWIHTFLGGRRILAPLRQAGIPRFVKATMTVCWHAITHCLTMVVVFLIAASLLEEPLLRRWLLILALAVSMPMACIFLIISKQTYGCWTTMPQSFLLGHIALWSSLALWVPVWLAPATSLSMLLGALLLIIAALHMIWARGISWPSRTQNELVQLVVGQPQGYPFPGKWMTSMVALALAATGGWLILTALAAVPLTGYRTLVWSLAAVFTLRGFGGFFEPLIRPWTVDLPYGYWNRVLYSPMSLAMGGMAFVIALAGV